jgi:carboxyl-terminal processing protease
MGDRTRILPQKCSYLAQALPSMTPIDRSRAGHFIRARQGLVLLLLSIMALGCQRPHPELAYLQAAVDTLYTHSLHQAQLDRDTLLRQVRDQLTDSSTRAHSHTILNALVSGIDPHSGLFLPHAVRAMQHTEEDAALAFPFSFRLLNDGIALVRVDGFEKGDSLSCGLYADSLQRVVLHLASLDPKGWLIDLRQNTGGNLYPMLAGLGPLLGCGDLGWDVAPNGTREAWWYCRDESHPEGASHITLVRTPHVLPDTLPAVVLISYRTGSAGEALAMSFIGRPRTRIYGERSAGFATNTRMCFLADSALLNITSGVMTDRTGGTHVEGIEPDRRFGSEEEALHAALDSLKVGPQLR